MSVTFNGTKSNPAAKYPSIVRTADEESEDSVGFNLANGNCPMACVLLEADLTPNGYVLPLADYFGVRYGDITEFTLTFDTGRPWKGSPWSEAAMDFREWLGLS